MAAFVDHRDGANAKRCVFLEKYLDEAMMFVVCCVCPVVWDTNGLGTHPRGVCVVLRIIL